MIHSNSFRLYSRKRTLEGQPAAGLYESRAGVHESSFIPTRFQMIVLSSIGFDTAEYEPSEVQVGFHSSVCNPAGCASLLCCAARRRPARLRLRELGILPLPPSASLPHCFPAPLPPFPSRPLPTPIRNLVISSEIVKTSFLDFPKLNLPYQGCSLL